MVPRKVCVLPRWSGSLEVVRARSHPSKMGTRDSLTNKRDFCPPPCAMYVPCCSIRAVSTAQATPDQHPEQTQIEQWPDFGNIAKRQTRPSPTQSTFSVDGALPGRCCAILAGSLHPPCLARQLGRARTEQQRGGEDVRSGRLLPGDQHTRRAHGRRRGDSTREAVLLGPNATELSDDSFQPS